MKIKIILFMIVFCARQLQAMDAQQSGTEVPKEMILARLADASSTIGDLLYLTKDDPYVAQLFYGITQQISESSTPKKYNLCQLAKIEIDKKDFKKAKELLDEAEKITGDKAYVDAQFYVAKGYFDELSGFKVQATINYRSALSLISNSYQIPLSAILHYKLGLMAEDDEKKDEAKNQYLQALQGIRTRTVPANIFAYERLCKLMGIKLDITYIYPLSPATSIPDLEKLRMKDLILSNIYL